MAIWGSRIGPKNRSNFDRMAERDHLLIVEGDRIRFMGHVAMKIESADLSRELWRPLLDSEEAGWDLIYFIANPRELDVPFAKFCNLFGHRENWRLYGFTAISNARLEAFYSQYDDLYSILARIQAGETVLPRETEADLPLAPLVPLEPEQVDVAIANELVSDHVRMQFKLARLGIKAGQKIWIPVSDQERLKRAYEFDQFEPRFSAGIDLPANYVENIDVVWKEEFRIDAAFEVENSTAIYSGLLRFADLSIIAPNSIYPMFIVAPAQRRGQVRSQLQRPAFQRLNVASKVRFLPYETIEEIDDFFRNSDSGLSVDLIKGKAEVLVST